MPLRLLCLPMRAARCGARLGFALGLGLGAALAIGGVALARAARSPCPRRDTQRAGWREPSPAD